MRDETGAEVEYRWNETSPLLGVVETVGTVLGRDPLELPSLAATLDPEALDAMVRSGDCVVAFQYADCHVTVTAAGRVSVERIE